MNSPQIFICTFLLFVVLPYAKAQAVLPIIPIGVRIYVQHIHSQKYIGKFNGVNGQFVPLVRNASNAQLFNIVLTARADLIFQVNRRPAYVNKLRGCNDPSDALTYSARTADERQLFTINNDGTIGSRCCENCLLHPTDLSRRLIIKEFNCETDCISRYLFKILTPNQLPRS